ncbi:N-formylglutamate amidohydrolase [Rosistilla carotiformis]|uniref:N-formylglutamate amidohydrolase n=1 Tax=Rosistilla carotiformis TaxID=2528017 RepID=A0A518K0A5_9BACT|nr:N-formylglutamate amidohydrolase [Rosistilla carotiformis]QDV71219.1 N-formylglutamate amidohydrolase [Rosistilla carotiformis]
MDLILTCEHATNHIPAEFMHLFGDAQAILASHRGWDPGSLALGRTLQRHCSAVLFRTTVSRLLVEVNRSPRHRQLFSEFSQRLEPAAKEAILQRYYWPHRRQVEAWIEDRLAIGNRVLHLSLHTFVSELHGQIRNADIGLLYDPRRGTEKTFCDRWHNALQEANDALRIRRNYPYLGRADGFTTALRRRFPGSSYAGIELEVNQDLVCEANGWRKLKRDIADALEDALSASS